MGSPRSWRVIRRPWRGLVALAAMLLGVLLVILLAAPRLSFIEVRVLDLMYARMPARQPDPHLVIVATDGDTFPGEHRLSGGTVCRRQAYMEATRRLARWGARVIAFDLQLEERCEQHDPELATAFREAGDVVVASLSPRPAETEPTRPGPDPREAAWAVGSPLTYRPNGTVRSISLVSPGESGPDQMALCLLAFQRFRGVEPEAPELVGGRWLKTAGVNVPVLPDERVRPLGPFDSGSAAPVPAGATGRVRPVPGTNARSIMLVNWVGRRGTIQPIRLGELLMMSDPRGSQVFGGKAVLIGEAGGKGDSHWTSVGLMSGLELHANALNTLLSERFIQPVSPLAMAGLLTVFVLATNLAVRRLGVVRGTGATVLVMAAAAASARQSLVCGVWVYPFTVELAIGLAWGITVHVESGRTADLLARLIPSFIRKRSGRSSLLDAAVLFSDIRSYTSAAERLSALETLSILTAHRTAMEEIVARRGGAIVKTPGDAILAVFWKTVQGRSHAECAVRAGREMLRALPRLAGAWEATGAKLRIGIGISAGQVAADLIGDRYIEPTVIGDAVNVAARLEALTKTLDYPLILCERVREHLTRDDAEAVVYLDELRLRGRKAPLRVYGVRGEDPPQRSTAEGGQAE